MGQHSVLIVEDEPGCNPPLGPSPASGHFTNTGSGFAETFADSFASGGSVGGVITVSATGFSSDFSNSIAVCFFARAAIDDIIVRGPGTVVSTRVSADLTGIVETGESMEPFDVNSHLSNLLARLSVYGGPFAPPVLFQPGTMSDDSVVDRTLTTTFFDAPIGQPFTVELFLRVDASAGSRRGFPGCCSTSSISSDYDLGMTFAEGGPVFDLPPGYTANSVDGQIVDNVYVPEPGADWMLAIGLVGLALVTNRRRTRFE